MVNQETVKNKSIIQSEDSTNHVKCVIDSGKSNSQTDLPAADVRSGNLSIPMGTMTYHALRNLDRCPLMTKYGDGPIWNSNIFEESN